MAKAKKGLFSRFKDAAKKAGNMIKGIGHRHVSGEG